VAYKGYRLSIFQLETILDSPVKKKWVVSMANTGKYGIPLYPEKSMEKYTQIKTSTDEQQSRLSNDWELIIKSLKNTRQTLAAGKYISALTLEWNKESNKEAKRMIPGNKGSNNPVSEVGSSLPGPPEDPGGQTEEYQAAYSVCSDLVIENLKVLKKTKKKISLSYEIKNCGEDKAKIFDPESDNNLAVKAYISGTPAISRGTTVLGGAYLDKNQNMSDVLDAGKSIKGTLEFRIEEVSRYTPVLVLEVDVFNLVSECDEGNNTKFVMLP
jgi:hypothetical protein